MKLENQVVSLQIAKKLKELGVKQESYFKHLITISGFEKIEESYHERKQFEGVFGRVTEEYSAFTVAELGEMLPYKDGWKITSVKQFDSQWECANRNLHGDGFEQYGETEADARGKMLIYLLENNLL